MNLIEQDIYQKNGRLVTELPTDNGVTLRKAVLAEDCMRDLVRPLRDAGWSVTVTEPDDAALFMTVTASCGEKQINVALLYSCGSDNSLYRTLAERCDAILYRGAPYHWAGNLRPQHDRYVLNETSPQLAQRELGQTCLDRIELERRSSQMTFPALEVSMLTVDCPPKPVGSESVGHGRHG